MTHEERRAEDPDLYRMLDEEMASCRQPEISDTDNASVDDLVKDMHKILTGNGQGAHRGLIMKVCMANVNIRLLREQDRETAERLDEQVEVCRNTRQDYEVARAGRDQSGEHAKAQLARLWKARKPLIFLIIAGVIYVGSIIFGTSTARVDKIVESKLAKHGYTVTP